MIGRDVECGLKSDGPPTTHHVFALAWEFLGRRSKQPPSGKAKLLPHDARAARPHPTTSRTPAMRRIPRLSRPIDRALNTAAAPRRPLQQCRACAFSTTTPAREDQKPLTERLRSKIWGTDYAPGREDPYSATSPMRPAERPAAAPQQPSKKKKAAVPAAAAASSSEAAAGPQRSEQSLEEFDPDYAPAKTWHGLEWVGGKDWEQEQEQLPSFKR